METTAILLSLSTQGKTTLVGFVFMVADKNMQLTL